LVPDLTCVRPTPASTLGSPGRRGRGLPAVGPGKRAPGLIRIPDALLASIAVRPGARDRFVGFVYNGNHLFAYKIDGLSAEAAEGLTVRYQPSDLSADFLTPWCGRCRRRPRASKC
jgi:hypothetical protein